MYKQKTSEYSSTRPPKHYHIDQIKDGQTWKTKHLLFCERTLLVMDGGQLYESKHIAFLSPSHCACVCHVFLLYFPSDSVFLWLFHVPIGTACVCRVSVTATSSGSLPPSLPLLQAPYPSISSGLATLPCIDILHIAHSAGVIFENIDIDKELSKNIIIDIDNGIVKIFVQSECKIR